MKKDENGRKNYCSDCQIDLETVAKFKYHRLKKHGKWKRSFECKSCDKKFATKSNLTKHCKLNHCQGDVTASKLSCNECNYSCHDISNFKIHLRIHSGEKPFICDRCSHAFNKKSDLTRHQRKPCKYFYECPKCLKVFHVLQQFQNHSSWDENCGSIRDKIGQAIPPNSSMVRLNTKSSFVIGVNCEQLANQEVFIKRSKRSKCGICSGCESLFDCAGQCTPCRTNKPRQCQLKQCHNLLTQYDVIKGQESKAKTIIESLQAKAPLRQDFLRFQIQSDSISLPTELEVETLEYPNEVILDILE